MTEKAKAGTAAALDFTNVKEGGGSFNKKRLPEGDYKAKVTKVQDAPSKKDNIMQWLFTIHIETENGTYPYYCKHQENQLWKIRNLMVAAGISVPKKRVKVDPNKIVGKIIGVTLEDDEYDGKMQSNIAAIFPASELTGDDPEDEAADDDDDEVVEDDEVTEAEADDEEVEDDSEEEADDEGETGDAIDALDRTELKRYIKDNGLDVKVFKSTSDDEIRDAIRAANAAPAAADDEDDELEEIDIEDV